MNMVCKERRRRKKTGKEEKDKEKRLKRRRGNSKSSHANNEGADVLNFVRAQLQNTFKYNSPVNEYGM
jgi:hypothetical protein